MHALDALADPVRRRLLELLAAQDHAAGEVSAVVEAEFGISQPAVARHLRVLRDAGLVARREAGRSRVYSLDPSALDEIEGAVGRYRTLWNQRLDALGTEIVRGRRERDRAAGVGDQLEGGRTAPEEEEG
ncbi:MAG: metalloregulator ArsR/SmtB family transcription factor [Actinomycetota bacterium]|nr:metalloregulator ArsR/SmtB family transcription factor [Actinomycetota bacterium]